MDAAQPLLPDLRAQALAVITRALGGEPVLSTTLAALGDLNTVRMLMDLEEAFAIPLDPDEVMAPATVAHLLLLVQRKVMVGPRLTRPPGEEGCTLYDLAAYRAELPLWRRRMLGPGAPPPQHYVDLAAATERGAAAPAKPLELVTHPDGSMEVHDRSAPFVLPIRAWHARRLHPVTRLVLGILAVAVAAFAALAAVTWCLDQLAAVGAGL